MDDIIRDAKVIITNNNKDALMQYYNDLVETYDANMIDYTYLFRHLYVHACLKKKHEIVAWFKELYEVMDPIMKIALRQIFAYGEYLLRR